MQTLFTGKNSISLVSVDSTNNYAANLIKETKVPEGTVIMAQYQSNGKGQRGNQWHSSAGENLLISVVFYPQFLAAKNQFLLSQCTCLAVHDFLTNLSIGGSMIKWPNDVLVKRKKIAGILIETNLKGNLIKSAIIGIGLNVNQEIFEGMRATSLRREKKEEQNILACKDLLLEQLEKRYLQIRSGKDQQLRKDYINNLYLYEEWADYKWKDQQVKAKITGVSAEGKLQLVTEQKEQINANMQEVKIIPS